ncbi:MAG: hypothetical protein Q8N18_00510 [Opitutaceae bacterium]|nr:hypothetical protein [Opitutaceae bacterium]
MKSTAKQWDDVRTAFSTSIMADTALQSLAENLDLPAWPIKGPGQTPSAYIDLTFDELVETFEAKGQPPELVDSLILIIKETLAFDSPFADMVENAESASARENPMLKNMAKLSLPENFPIALTALDADTLEFCKLERLATLGEFAVFAQSMAKNVILGGDFKKLVNALSHIDEAALAQVLPFRRGHRGLHLIEAVGQAARAQDGETRVELATAWFSDDVAAIEKDLAAGGTLERQFSAITNPAVAHRAAELLRPHLRLPAAAQAKTKRSGWFARLLGR